MVKKAPECLKAQPSNTTSSKKVEREDCYQKWLVQTLSPSVAKVFVDYSMDAVSDLLWMDAQTQSCSGPQAPPSPQGHCGYWQTTSDES